MRVDHIAQTTDAAQNSAGIASARRENSVARWLRLTIARRLRSYGPSVALDIVLVTAAFLAAAVVRTIDSPNQAPRAVETYLAPAVVIGVIYAIVSYFCGLHRRLWQYASVRDGLRLIQAVILTAALVTIIVLLRLPFLPKMPLSILVLGPCLSFMLLGSVKIIPRVAALTRTPRPAGDAENVLIVGAGAAGSALAARFLIDRSREYRVVGFVDDDRMKWSRHVQGKPVLAAISDIPAVVSQCDVDLIAIAIPSASSERISQIIELAQQTPASVKILPGLNEIAIGHSRNLREVNVADLLGRQAISLRASEATRALSGKTILVTGAAGSIGSELCRQLLNLPNVTVVALDNNETGLFDLAEGIEDRLAQERLHARVGDITDETRMARLFETVRPHIVFHAAAYKHVPMLEEYPDQAIRVNVFGTYQLCMLARSNNVEQFVFISTDKAAAPINVLGASKRLGELIVQALASGEESRTRFCAVRFGNVIGSRGSVVPTFMRQIERGGPVTVTDPDTTRYFMTIPEACGLVILTSTLEGNGALYLLDMGEPVRIADVATKMIRLRGLRVDKDISVVFTGLRPGEKLHEALAADEERLERTANEKIFHLRSQVSSPSLAQMSAWVSQLERSLATEDLASQRTALLALTSEKEVHMPMSAQPSLGPTLGAGAI
jgi:FlaA1/EpsC-like NDP-sugar epimerase